MEHYQHFLLDKLTHISGVTGCVRASCCAASNTRPPCPQPPGADNPPHPGGTKQEEARASLLLLSAIKGARGQHAPTPSARWRTASMPSTWLTSCTCSNQPLCSCRGFSPLSRNRSPVGTHCPLGRTRFPGSRCRCRTPSDRRPTTQSGTLPSPLWTPACQDGAGITALDEIPLNTKVRPAPTEWRA